MNVLNQSKIGGALEVGMTDESAVFLTRRANRADGDEAATCDVSQPFDEKPTPGGSGHFSRNINSLTLTHLIDHR